MTTVVVVTRPPAGLARRLLAAEALTRAARAAGHDVEVEPPDGPALPAEVLGVADVVVLATDAGDTDTDPRLFGRTVVRTDTAAAIRDAAGIVARLPIGPAPSVPARPAEAPAVETRLHIVAVTSCPTGIAHTFMAAEGLEGGARTLGHVVKVETRGSVGARNALTPGDIADADLVVIAADTNVDLARFAGKRLYQTGTKPAIKDGAAVLRTAIAEAVPYGTRPASDYLAEAKAGKAALNAQSSAVYKHLMTGVSHMLPFVVAGGLLMVVAFAVGSVQFGDQGIFINEDRFAGTLAHTLFVIGSQGAFGLFVPVLAGYIAYSIADRPGLAPGMIGGYLAVSTGSGFLGGIVAGFLAGYTVSGLTRVIKLPRTLEGLKPTLVLPLLGTLVVGILMVYVVGTPVAAALTALTRWLEGLGSTSAGLLGGLLGAMMAFDMGGPVNKAAYTFSTGLLGAKVYGPIAAAMAGGMTPPLALSLATVLFKDRFTPEEREAGKAAAVLGLAFITEGAIPFVARDPLRVIPALVAGSAVAGAISMAAGCLLRVPHGGVFVLFIPNAVTNLPFYVVALVAGTVVSTALLGLLKRPLRITEGDEKIAA